MEAQSELQSQSNLVENANTTTQPRQNNRIATPLFVILVVAIALNASHIYVAHPEKQHHESVAIYIDNYMDLPRQRDASIYADHTVLIDVDEKTQNPDSLERPKKGRPNKTTWMDQAKMANAESMFMKQHENRKEQFIAEQSKNATSEEHKQQLVAMAEAAFVDLDRDEHPHVSKQISDHHKDPWFVLHIGPPKTATTTIQCGLERHALRLAKTDGYHYMGGGCGAEGKTYIMPNGEAVVLRKQIADALNLPTPNPVAAHHLEDFVQRAKVLRSKGRSLILSSELFGSRLQFHAPVMKKLKQMILSQENGAGWNPSRVKIVLAYRHFVDWLPSYHFQNNANYAREVSFATDEVSNGKSLEDRKVQPFLEYADQYLASWEAYQRAVRERAPSEEEHILLTNESFLPKDRRSIHPSWWLYQLWSMHFPLEDQVEVYDMHSPMNSNRPNDDIVTNFVCNMLPGAIQTCSKMIQLEDEIEQKRQSDASAASSASAAASSNTTRLLTASNVGMEEFDYDSLELHSPGSFLWKKPENQVTKITSNRKKNRPSMESTDKGMNVRASHDLDAVMVVEDLMIKGDIPRFNYSNYGIAFFKSNPDLELLKRTHHKGLTKKLLIEEADKALKAYNISAPDHRYYKCMDKELEARFLNASLTFVEMMYKQTNMLNKSALASTHDDHPERHKLMEAEKETRYAQALKEHQRLFEKNKAKGKYCDIDPNKVFVAFPEIHQALTKFSFKPNYRTMQRKRLPATAAKYAEYLEGALGIKWQRLNSKMTFEDLTARQKTAAFYLGYSPYKNET